MLEFQLRESAKLTLDWIHPDIGKVKVVSKRVFL